VPQLVGGSADLAGSNGVSFGDAAAFESAEVKSADAGSAQPAAVPRVVHWGVREHAMGSAVNGMALHGGVVPLAATFLIFSDYMRPALRLAALMKIPTRYVFSHDSIGLGEDGPTHQPVEQLSSLRAIPDFTVLRPADANEAVECWKVALERPGPAALVLTRQNVPILDRAHYGGAEGARRGAYVLSEANGEARALVIGTGSEVHVALEGQRLLQDRGIPTRVVSMPSWELFAEQDESYREAVLPEAIGARVAVEAGVRHGWERWVGRSGGFVTLDRFGASAPYETLYRELGITAERVAEEVQRALERPER
jgi:transketolase